MKSRTLCFVSPDRRRAEIARQAFEGWPVSTVWAPCVEEMRDLCRRSPPDVVAFDQVSSGVDWREPLDVAQNYEIPMIAILERFDSNEFSRILKAGAADVIAGPLSPARLYGAVAIAAPDLLAGARRSGGDWLRRLLHL